MTSLYNIEFQKNEVDRIIVNPRAILALKQAQNEEYTLLFFWNLDKHIRVMGYVDRIINYLHDYGVFHPITLHTKGGRFYFNGNKIAYTEERLIVTTDGLFFAGDVTINSLSPILLEFK